MHIMMTQNASEEVGFYYTISEHDVLNSKNEAIQSCIAEVFTTDNIQRKTPDFIKDLLRNGINLPNDIDSSVLIAGFCTEQGIETEQQFSDDNLGDTTEFHEYVSSKLAEYYTQKSSISSPEEIVFYLINFYSQNISYLGQHIISDFFKNKEEIFTGASDAEITPLLDENGEFYLSVVFNSIKYTDYVNEKTMSFPGSYTYRAYLDKTEEGFKFDPSSLKASNKAFELMAKGDYSKSIDEIIQFADAQERFNSTYVNQNNALATIEDEFAHSSDASSDFESSEKIKTITLGLQTHCSELFFESGHLFEKNLLSSKTLSDVLYGASDTLKSPSSQNAKNLLKTGNKLQNTFSGRKIGGILLLLGGTLLAVSSGVAAVFTGGATIAGCVAGAAMATAGGTMLGLGPKNRVQFFGETTKSFKNSVEINEDYNDNPEKYSKTRTR